MKGLSLTTPPKPLGGRYIAAKIYPTGDGVIYPRPRPRKGKDSEPDAIAKEYNNEEDFWEENSALFGVRAACAKLLAVAAINPDMQAARVQGEGEPIESTSAAISHTPRSRKGSMGITTRSGRVLRFGAGTIERRAGSPTNLSFLTLTLPAMSEDAWERVCIGWGDIVRTFVQWLTRKLKAKGLPALIVGCIELQTKRAARSGEPALHIHAVFQGRRKKQSWAVTPLQCRNAWKRAVTAKSKEPLDFSNTENLVQVRKSASRYLAKYLSKGGGEWRRLVAPRYADLHPCSWTFTPDSIKKDFARSTWTGDEALAVLTLALNNPQYRYGEVVSLPIYCLPNGQWVKVALIKLDRAFALSLDPRWVP